MASDNEASCASDPNFAVICSFLECFGKSCGIIYPDIARLQEMLENTQEVPQQLIDLHIKLLRKTRKTVSPEKWERALVKFCHTYSNQDGWELERFGYKKARIAVKLRLLKVLLETQFDLNQKFKNEVNKLAANELRVEPLGRDKSGLAYWCQLDEECNIRVYREDLDEENWELVAKDREGVVNLISTLSNGEAGDIPINEDSNSLEISEKPIIDTGQVTTSPSLEDEAVQENGMQPEGLDEKELDKSGAEDFEDEQDQDELNDVDNDEDDMEPEEDVTNDESSKQNTEEDDSQEMIQDHAIESNVIAQPSAPVIVSKALNGKIDAIPEQEVAPPQEKEIAKPEETPVSLTSDTKCVELQHKVEEVVRTNSLKADIEEPMALKSIETPVITSPLKLVNIAELKQSHEEKSIPPVTPIGTSLSITKKHNIYDDSTDSVMKSLEKLSGKNNLTFTPTEMPTIHSKLSVKPIDQLAANLVRIQSEKLEKPSGAKSLEKIAESLARSGSMLGNMMNGEDDRLPQDYCARSQAEKASALRGHRGMDLSTSPRGWETTNEQNRPMDFSGIDLSSRKFNKTLDSPVPGYRQDFQQREMDLSTKKLNKPEISSMPYDARTVMMRSHAMVTDLSKRQMPFTAYEMPSAAYHNAARIPSKEEHRLPNYTILPDPSKITALRMSAAPVKRPLEGDDAQQEILKRIRADVIPIRGSMDKRSMIGTNWRDEVGEAIEEPVMMVQGEGSGSDCDAINPGLGEPVEEPTIFFYGEGSGQECETGNPGDEASADNKQSNEAKNEADSASASLSPNKLVNDDNLVNDTPAESVVTNNTPIRLNRNYPQSSINVKDNCQIVGSTQEKPKFKPTLGIQIIPKSVSGPVKRISRWDVGKPDERTECDSSIISNEGDISPKRSTYDYECHNTGQNVLSADKQPPYEGLASASHDVKIDGNSVTETESEERNVEVKDAEENSQSESAENAGQSPTVQDSMQCDSSISLCQADTSEAFESCTEAVPKNHSLNEKNIVEDTYENDNTSSHQAEPSKRADSECKQLPASPPRFFFGPNCISYTSKSEESPSDATVTTSVNSKPDTLQYECVSSSKPVEEPVMPYKSDDFDITQTNNNSLKINSFTAESNNALCETESKVDTDKIEGPSNLWDQTISSKYKVEPQSYVIPKTEASISNSESKVEAKESAQLSNVQDPISSSESMESSYVQKTQFSDIVSQPHSTHDSSTLEEEPQLSTEQENVVAEPSLRHCNTSTESAECEREEDRGDDFGESSEREKSDTQDNIDEITSETPSGSLKEDEDCNNENLVKDDSAMPTNSCSVPLQENEVQDKSNFNELSCISTTEFPGYQEVDSSANQDMDPISDKYSSFKKSESNSPGESYDKQSDKNDNFSEIDGQEEQSLDTDNERMKNLAGSDADSMCVNYDKNSERFDAFSDAGAQDEGFGDSGEMMKDKSSGECVVRDSVPDVNVERDFADNSAVTSSESMGQCNKDASVPTISSSDDACTQDTSSQESSDVQVDSEKLEDTSSVKDERLSYSILPAIVPDTNIFKPSNSDNVELRKEISLSNIVQTTNEYADDASENRSSCIDQDSNEDMVIDDRLSESNNSPKESEEAVPNEEKFRSIESFQRDKNIVDTNRSTSEPHISSVKEDPAAEPFGIVPKIDEKAAESSLDVQEKLPDVSDDTDTDNQVGSVIVQQSEDIVKPEKVKADENQERSFSNNNVEVVDDFQKRPCTPEVKEPNSSQTETIATEDFATSEPKDKQSLVANYDSGDSNDGSDDVFESDSTEPNEAKTEFYGGMEQLTVNKEQTPEVNLEERVVKQKPSPPNNSQNVIDGGEETEVKVEQKVDEFAIKEEMKVKQEDSVLAEVDQTPYNCSDIQNNLNDKKIPTPINDNKFKEGMEPRDSFSVDSGKLNDVVELSKPTLTAESRDIFSNQINKECINTAFVSTNCLMPAIKEEESKSVMQVTEKMTNFAEDKKTNPTHEIEKFEPTKENLEFNDMNNQMDALKPKESHVKPTEEKVITNLGNDGSFMKIKDVDTRLTEKPLVDQPYGKLEEFSDLGDKKNKLEMKLQSEYYLSKSAEGVDMSVQSASIQSASNISPLKRDNVSPTTNKSEILGTDHIVKSEEVKLTNNLNFANYTPEKSENLESLGSFGNHNKSFNIKNTTESIHNNAFSTGNDTGAFTVREPAVAVEKLAPKKEGNKLLCDISDSHDVPPLKSKPRCIEPNEEMPRDVSNTEMLLDANLDSFKQAEVPVEGATLTEKLADANAAPAAEESTPVISMEKQTERNENQEIKEGKENTDIQSVEVKASSVISDDSMGADNECLFAANADEADPLAGTEDDDTLKKLTEITQEDPSVPKIGIRVKSVFELVYEGWKLDSTEPPKVPRKRRNSSHESNSEDGGAKEDGEETVGGKRIKLWEKRTSEKQLRKSVEESHKAEMSTEDEAEKCSPEKTEKQEGKDVSDDQSAANAAAMERKVRGRPRGRRKRGNKRSGSKRQKHSELQGSQLSEVSPGPHVDGTPSNDSSLSMTPSAQKKRKKRKMVLGLEIGRDIAPEVEAGVAQDETPVRQSRRIAQLKIKEEADRRRIEEEALSEMKEKKESAEKKKRKKQKVESEEDVVVKEAEKEKKSKKKRRKRKKKKMLAKFNEANPWQSSSGSSSDDDDENEDEEDEEEEIESEGSLLFKSDHEFSPESDLEKDQESEPLRRARTAQKAQSDVEEADDEYACQKCGKADHPEWILLCDSCDKGWHCSCLRPALMLIPEGDWFCPPCQHNLLVAKLRESLKTYDQLSKRHENEVLRKKRLAFVGISLDNVLHKGETPRSQKGSKASSQESDNDSTSSSSESSTETSSSDESEPVYQLRERRCANTYKFNEYDDMINAAIQDEVEAVQGAGNQGRGKDIATIVNAEKEEAQLQFQAETLAMDEVMQEDKDISERKSEKDSDEEYKIEGDELDEDEEEQKAAAKKLLARKKHRKLNSLDISSEDDPESDEDFKGTSSEEEEDFDDHITSSDESTFMDVKRRGKRGDSRPVRRSTRARMTTRYDEDFINDESEESDRPKRKKSRSMWGDSDSEDSDNSWRQRKKKSRTISTSRCRTLKVKNKKKKKRKRIIESDNQSDNDEEDDARAELSCEPHLQQIPQPQEPEPQLQRMDPMLPTILEPKLENTINNENNGNEINNDTKDVKLETMNTEIPTMPAIPQEDEQKKKKEVAPKPKKTPGIRRKIIYGGLPDENRQKEEEILGRRTRGRKINYQEELGSDSEEELKKALRKTGESEDEFVVNEGDDMNDDNDKDSDSGDIYNPKKDGPKFKNKSPKNRRPRKSKSPGAKRKAMADGMPKQRKKPGPKPGSKNKARKQKFMMSSVIKTRDDQDGDMMVHMMENPMGEVESKIEDNLAENVGLTGTTMSVASSFTGDVPEGSLTGLGAGELAELDDEQLEQMMMEDEEYGRRQLELAAIEIAKKKKKEEREAKKLEKARLKALEILAAERQRDPNAPEGTDGEAPKKKKRGRRSKAEILAEQMRRDGAPNLTGAGLTAALPATVAMASSVSPTVNPLSAVMTPDAERTSEGHIPMITGPDGQLFNPDGTPVKPKRRGRGKGKKTLALEAARAAEAAAKAAAEAGLIGMGTDSNPEIKPGDIPNVLPTPGSSTSGSAPSTPPAGPVSGQGPPSTQPSNSQSVYPSLPPNQQSSVITRMLQSQPVSSSPQSFTAAAAAMGHKYFGGPNTGGQMMGGPRTGYEMQPRGRIPSPYRQAGQSSMPPHFAAVRSGTPPMRMRVPGPQMYHTPHHPMDPSPSGGGPISINNRDRSSPLGPGPAMIPPAAGSPLAKGGPTPPPPPPPYVRGGPPLSRFADNPMGPRHQMPPFTNASPVNHNMQQPSPPPNRPPGNFSPYHPPPPPNYHYGAYPPPPPMSTADDAAAYQGSPYPAEHFSSPADNQPPIQAPPPPPPPQGPPQQQAHPNDAGVAQKQYDEEGSGEFGGLVSYFSSQREDDLDS